MKISVLVRKSILFPSHNCRDLEMQLSHTKGVLFIKLLHYLNHCLDNPIHNGNVSTNASAMRKKLTVDDLRSFLLATIADKMFPMKNKQKYCYFMLAYCHFSVVILSVLSVCHVVSYQNYIKDTERCWK